MATINFTTTATTFSVLIDGVSQGTWDRLDEIDSDFSLQLHDTYLNMALTNPYLSKVIRSTDTIQKDGVAVAGATFRAKVATLKDEVFFKASSGGTATLQEVTDLGSTTSNDLEITNTLKGVILKSPDNSRWRITITNAGVLVSTQIV